LSPRLELTTAIRLEMLIWTCRHSLALLCLVLLAWPSAAPRAEDLSVDCQAAQPQWSVSQPPVNLTHIFCGERKGDRVTGYHALAEHWTAGEARVARFVRTRNSRGVYVAWICLEARLCKASSMFPDHWPAERVLAAILEAFADARIEARGKWRGHSAEGIEIQGWLLPDGRRINTAYPLYRAD
jgi:hypothetical protein